MARKKSKKSVKPIIVLLLLAILAVSVWLGIEKFKNSQVISPVFGVKRDVIYKKEYNELGETIDIKELDMEIKKTEEFLKQLKRLKDKLD